MTYSNHNIIMHCITLLKRLAYRENTWPTSLKDKSLQTVALSGGVCGYGHRCGMNSFSMTMDISNAKFQLFGCVP